MYQKQSIG